MNALRDLAPLATRRRRKAGPRIPGACRPAAFAAGRLAVGVVVLAGLIGGCQERRSAQAVADQAATQWQTWQRCEDSRQRLERCPRGTGARKRLRDDCAMSDRVARLLDPGYPRCLEPALPRP